jgi:hypothetical protein
VLGSIDHKCTPVASWKMNNNSTAPSTRTTGPQIHGSIRRITMGQFAKRGDTLGLAWGAWAAHGRSGKPSATARRRGIESSCASCSIRPVFVWTQHAGDADERSRAWSGGSARRVGKFRAVTVRMLVFGLLVLEIATTAERGKHPAARPPCAERMADKADIASSDSVPTDAAVLASCGSVNWSLLER